jgi:hypothetical protein
MSFFSLIKSRNKITINKICHYQDALLTPVIPSFSSNKFLNIILDNLNRLNGQDVLPEYKHLLTALALLQFK